MFSSFALVFSFAPFMLCLALYKCNLSPIMHRHINGPLSLYIYSTREYFKGGIVRYKQRIISLTNIFVPLTLPPWFMHYPSPFRFCVCNNIRFPHWWFTRAFRVMRRKCIVSGVGIYRHFTITFRAFVDPRVRNCISGWKSFPEEVIVGVCCQLIQRFFLY